MLIRIKRPWFTPDTSGNTSRKYVGKNQRPIARGSLLRVGEHEVSDDWKDILPSDAQVISEYSEDDADEDDFYVGHVQQAQVTSLAAITAQAEGEQAAKLKQQRVDNLKKAREAKKEKAANA